MAQRNLCSFLWQTVGYETRILSRFFKVVHREKQLKARNSHGRVKPVSGLRTFSIRRLTSISRLMDSQRWLGMKLHFTERFSCLRAVESDANRFVSQRSSVLSFRILNVLRLPPSRATLRFVTEQRMFVGSLPGTGCCINSERNQEIISSGLWRGAKLLSSALRKTVCVTTCSNDRASTRG